MPLQITEWRYCEELDPISILSHESYGAFHSSSICLRCGEEDDVRVRGHSARSRPDAPAGKGTDCDRFQMYCFPIALPIRRDLSNQPIGRQRRVERCLVEITYQVTESQVCNPRLIFAHWHSGASAMPPNTSERCGLAVPTICGQRIWNSGEPITSAVRTLSMSAGGIPCS